MSRCLILSGGPRHDFASAAEALTVIFGDAGIRSETTTDIEAGLARVAQGEFDLVTVHALRWRMLNGEKYSADRAQWGFSLSERGYAALECHVARGGGLLALHTACICFDDWRAWRHLLGGVWVWGQSFHPPRGVVSVSTTGIAHSITIGCAEFQLDHDEVFSDLSLMPDIEPLLMARSHDPSAENRSYPALWARQVGRGRVVVDTLGHDRRSFQHPAHRQIVSHAALWALGCLDSA